MALKVSKLWGDTRFQNLTVNAKLLLIYLLTNPNINTVGVLNLNIDVATSELKLTINELRKVSVELLDNKYIKVVKENNLIYFIIINYFTANIKSDIYLSKVYNEIDVLPSKVKRTLTDIGVVLEKKISKFVEPTEKEVTDYCLEKGYLIDAKTFIEFYRENGKKYSQDGKWYDGRGSIVLDWKAKLRKVWFKEERKIKPCKGAPKGKEYYHIIYDGKIITPDYWSNGKPYSKDFLLNKELQKTYDKLSENS